MSNRPQLVDLELERRYLGDVLHASVNERSTHFAAPERAGAVDMGSSMHGRILGAVHELHRAQADVSPLTVQQLLEKAESRGAIDALQDIVDKYDPQLDSLAVMSARLVQLARARRIREHHVRGLDAAERLDLDAAQEHAHEALGEHDRGRVDLVSLHDSALLAVQSARKATADQQLRRIPFGYALLDDACKGGLRPSTMAIIGGRTGSGKSTLMLGCALQQTTWGMRVGIVSCEDSAELWGERALAHFTRQPVEQLLGQQLSMSGSDPLGRALGQLKRVGVQLVYALNRPLTDVLAAVRALIADGCRVIYVDYVQAILLGSRGERKELVRDAAQRIKAECQQHGAALVLGSQLTRANPKDRFAEPFEAELKETGDLENMTEVVCLLWKTSDAEDAKALGKLSKVKWSPRRPRFQLLRDDATGALCNVAAYDSGSNGHTQPQPRPTWSE